LLISGCALAPKDAPRYTAVPQAPEGYATVYLLRNQHGTNVATTKMLVAGVHVAELPLQSYTWLYVKAGTQNIAAEWPVLLKQPNTSVNHTLEAGKKYYFRIRTGVAAGVGFFSSAIVLSSMLDALPPEQGEAELIACCGYLRSYVEKI
jgi:hypothetical protein